MSPTGFQWFESVERRFTTTGPFQAHLAASAEACGVGAKKVGGRGSGTLARDVSTPLQTGPLRALAGSNLPYAAMENWGGTIRPRTAQRLLIRGRRLGAQGQLTRSDGPGAEIVASAEEVEHEGKHWLDAIVAAYPKLLVANLKRVLPQGRVIP